MCPSIVDMVPKFLASFREISIPLLYDEVRHNQVDLAGMTLCSFRNIYSRLCTPTLRAHRGANHIQQPAGIEHQHRRGMGEDQVACRIQGKLSLRWHLTCPG